jgi:hypothetical protein
MPGGRDKTVLTWEFAQKLARDHATLRSEMSNLRRHLAHMSLRRHEAVWAPAQAGIPPLSYRCDDVEGFSGSGPAAVLQTGNQVGWLGAANKYGSESEVGFEFDSSETSPSTNGNWECTKTGLFYVSLEGRYNFALASAFASPLNPEIVIRLYEKQEDISIRHYEDADGNNRQDYVNKWQFDSTFSDHSVQYHTSGIVYVEAGTRLTWRLLLINPTNIRAEFFDGERPTFNIWRLGDSDMERTVY